jgi:acetolactate synthase regulatory subunit
VIVENEPGVLARVIGLFSGRGYNIDSLTVAEVDHTGHRSRITIVTRGTPAVIDQIEAQLSRMVPVHAVQDLTDGRPKRSSASWRWSRLRARATTGSRRCAWPRSSARTWSIPRWKASSSR